MQVSSIKGRGVSTNPLNRFQSVHSIPDQASVCREQSILTEVIEQTAVTVISKNQSPDVPHDQSINPYAGCEHGCVYCYARPTHAYHDLSPGLDFETKIIVKTNAADCFEQEINKANYKVKPVLIGANTDPYQPIEKQQQLTRKLLQVCLERSHPVTLITKSGLIERDLDLLGPLAHKGLCSVRISVTTLDDGLKRKLEPRTASGSARLDAISKLSAAGVPTGVLVAPVIPAINDCEIEAILEASKLAGATSASYVLLRLPLEVKDLFSDWLQLHYPQRAKHVLSLITQSRGGKMYEAKFGKRMTGEGVFADMIRKRFDLACHRFGLQTLDSHKFNYRLFSKEAFVSQESSCQMSLF
jgi:DNA repair photolyase